MTTETAHALPEDDQLFLLLLDLLLSLDSVAFDPLLGVSALLSVDRDGDLNIRQ